MLSQRQKNYGIPPAKFELNDNNNDFEGSVEPKADEKTMKTIITPHRETIFICELNVVLGLTKKKHADGTHLS